MSRNGTFDDAHALMPADVAARIPPLYGAEQQSDPVALLKWFAPDSSWSWYVVEFSPEERTCFGLVDGHEAELGYFSLAEIEQLRGPLGLPVERDVCFAPTPLSEVRRELEQTRER
ncbi:DUF2958 domain-containing protein [Pirellulales bacterium]|nr:DUF2958 domain-containing protein [Pirellulales bacterium]